MSTDDRLADLLRVSAPGAVPLLFGPVTLMPHVGLVPLFDPKPGHIVPEQLARGLAREGRYANGGAFHYSVAEHSWLVSMLCPIAPLQGLVHDGPEAWLGDMIGPLKTLLRMIERREVSSYDLVEQRWWHAVADRFGVPREMHARVEYVDKALRVVEQHELYPGCEDLIRGMPGIGPNWLAEQSDRLGLPEPLRLRFLSPGDAYELFMERLREVWPEARTR